MRSENFHRRVFLFQTLAVFAAPLSALEEKEGNFQRCAFPDWFKKGATDWVRASAASESPTMEAQRIAHLYYRRGIPGIRSLERQVCGGRPFDEALDAIFEVGATSQLAVAELDRGAQAKLTVVTPAEIKAWTWPFFRSSQAPRSFENAARLFIPKADPFRGDAQMGGTPQPDGSLYERKGEYWRFFKQGASGPQMLSYWPNPGCKEPCSVFVALVPKANTFVTSATLGSANHPIYRIWDAGHMRVYLDSQEMGTPQSAQIGRLEIHYADLWADYVQKLKAAPEVAEFWTKSRAVFPEAGGDPVPVYLVDSEERYLGIANAGDSTASVAGSAYYNHFVVIWMDGAVAGKPSRTQLETAEKNPVYQTLFHELTHFQHFAVCESRAKQVVHDLAEWVPGWFLEGLADWNAMRVLPEFKKQQLARFRSRFPDKSSLPSFEDFYSKSEFRYALGPIFLERAALPEKSIAQLIAGSCTRGDFKGLFLQVSGGDLEKRYQQTSF